MLPAKFEPVPRLDPEHPLPALSLPAWLQRCASAMTADSLSPTIPTELQLSDEQRAAVALRVDDLSEAELAYDVDHTSAVVVELLEGFGGARLSDDQARLKAKAYITALEEVPTWAVVEAARRWLQAKAGPQSYDFAPSPPRLRQISDHVLAELRAQRVTLTRLLKAKPERSVERDPAVRQAVTRQFGELLHHLRSHTTEPFREQTPEAKVV